MAKMDKIDTSNWGYFKAFLYVVWGGVVAGLNYLGIDSKMVIILGCALAFDWITGAIKAFRLKKFESRRSINGIIDKTVLMCIPLFVAFFFKVFGIDIGISTQIIFALLTLSEFYSSLANIYTTRTGKELPEYDAVTAMIRWLHKTIISFIRKKTEDEPDKKL